MKIHFFAREHEKAMFTGVKHYLLSSEPLLAIVEREATSIALAEERGIAKCRSEYIEVEGGGLDAWPLPRRSTSTTIRFVTPECLRYRWAFVARTKNARRRQRIEQPTRGGVATFGHCQEKIVRQAISTMGVFALASSFSAFSSSYSRQAGSTDSRVGQTPWMR